ncbi:MAG: DUF2066 domain-containing protein, partial [Gammaproteobacteria bacterium]|nr:DUF2066 domain-containing protein [Gammaproteobacteria bacterium]
MGSWFRRDAWRAILVLLVLCCGIQLGQADEITGLYETEVSVSTQSPEERQAALIAAMRQILLRVSGRSIVLTITAIEQALEKPT